MNESILLELKKIRDLLSGEPSEENAAEAFQIATEAIKKWEDSSGKETGISEGAAVKRLKETEQQYDYFNEIGSMARNDKFTFYPEKYAELATRFHITLRTQDESVPPYKGEEHKCKFCGSYIHKSKKFCDDECKHAWEERNIEAFNKWQKLNEFISKEEVDGEKIDKEIAELKDRIAKLVNKSKLGFGLDG